MNERTERRSAPDWCVVGAHAALLHYSNPATAVLVTIIKVNKIKVTVTDERSCETALSVARGLSIGMGTWAKTTELVSADDPRVLTALAAQARAHTTRVVTEALVNWAKSGDADWLRVAIERLQRHADA